MRIEYEKEAAKHIGKMDRPTKQRLKIAIEKLPAGDVKKLQGIKDDYAFSTPTYRQCHGSNTTPVAACLSCG